MKTALWISYVNITLNIVLACVKLAVGLMTGSKALLSDGVHAFTDVLSSFVVLIGIRLSARLSDRQHPYGHERMECVAAVLLSVLVSVTGIGIGMIGLRTIWGSSSVMQTSPGNLALGVTLISVLIKEIMFRYTKCVAVRVGSGALLADAWHFRSDVLSSIGGFVGVLGANLGFPILDPLAAVVIGACIVKAAITIFADAMRRMTDCSCDDVIEDEIVQRALRHPQVKGVCELKTRVFGNRIIVELTVNVDSSLSCVQAFTVVNEIEQAVCKEIGGVKYCAVHIHPL